MQGHWSEPLNKNVTKAAHFRVLRQTDEAEALRTSNKKENNEVLYSVTKKLGELKKDIIITYYCIKKKITSSQIRIVIVPHFKKWNHSK
jgi:hypothetical protein